MENPFKIKRDQGIRNSPNHVILSASEGSLSLTEPYPVREKMLRSTLLRSA
jgi:hypothetical protein